MLNYDSAVDPVITTVAILGTLAFFAFVGWVMACVREIDNRQGELLDNDLVQARLTFDAIRRIEALERELAAKHKVGWIREVSEN